MHIDIHFSRIILQQKMSLLLRQLSNYFAGDVSSRQEDYLFKSFHVAVCVRAECVQERSKMRSKRAKQK